MKLVILILFVVMTILVFNNYNVVADKMDDIYDDFFEKTEKIVTNQYDTNIIPETTNKINVAQIGSTAGGNLIVCSKILMIIVAVFYFI
jgi:hypothetical protein